MSRELDEAHYLHKRRGLELLIRPRIDRAAFLDWDGHGEAVVATVMGDVFRVHPAKGTRLIMESVGRLSGMAVENNEIVAVMESGKWARLGPTGEVLQSGQHPFLGPVAVVFRNGQMLLCGDTDSERHLLFNEGDSFVLRVRLPDRAVAFVQDGRVGFVQSSEEGLETIMLAKDARFRGRVCTHHRLVACDRTIVGFLGDEVLVWQRPDSPSRRLEIEGPTIAARSGADESLAIGTDDGRVVLVDMSEPASYEKPDIVQVGDARVRAISFAKSGKFLATACEGVQIWTWG